MVFQDRHEAGRLLAMALADYGGQDGVIYALPRGGVPLAAEIGRFLGMPVELAITRKIGHPANPEYAICAVAEDGTLVCNEEERQAVPADWLARRVAEERAEAARRRQRYRGGACRHAGGILAVVVDDGVATGLTMIAALEALRAERPHTLVVAVPVLPADVGLRLRRKADALVALEESGHYRGSVGAYYRDFRQLSDEDVLAELAGAQR